MAPRARSASVRLRGFVLAVSGLIVVAVGLSMAWNSSNTPSGSLAYAELLQRLKATQDAEGIERAEPTMDCDPSDRFCANAVRFDFTIPGVTDARQACETAYSAMLPYSNGQVLRLNYVEVDVADAASFVEKCVASISSQSVVVADMRGNTDLLGESAVQMTLAAPGSGVSLGWVEFGGQVVVHNTPFETSTVP